MPETSYLDVARSEVARRGVEIPRRRGLDVAGFERDHLNGVGQPVVVTDAIDRWGDAREWSFDLFRSRYPSDPITANSPFLLEEVNGLVPVQLQMQLRDYIDYVLDPSIEPVGTYLKGSLRALRANGIPLYAPAYRVFLQHPELRANLDPSPYFLDDLFALLPRHLKSLLDRLGSPVYYLFFAPRGATVFLHEDHWETHAYLAQLEGVKFCILFSPEESHLLYDGEVLDPVTCDLERYPRVLEATPHVAELRKGEMLFVPSRWRHFVVTLEPSLTFSYDFFTRSNMGAYLSHFFLRLARLIATDQDPVTLAHARQVINEALAEVEIGSTTRGSDDTR